MKQKLAVFDIDGTVFRSSLLIELVEALIKEKVFPESARGDFKKAHDAWVNREGTYDAYIDAVVHSFMEHIRGVYYGDFADVGKEVVEAQSKRVYRYTRDLIRDLKEQDYFVVAISQSPKTMLDDFCASYGFDKVYGRIYELGPQDKFTGVVSEESLISNKALIVERILERQKNLTLDGSIGVGDTESDIPFLEKVETSICFNPNMKLYEHAKKMKWPVIVERKDVIYTI